MPQHAGWDAFGREKTGSRSGFRAEHPFALGEIDPGAAVLASF
jgi:hypothetical protein